jgi:hypothetical protein
LPAFRRIMLPPFSRHEKMEASRFVRSVNKFLPEHMVSHARRRHSFFSHCLENFRTQTVLCFLMWMGVLFLVVCRCTAPYQQLCINEQTIRGDLSESIGKKWMMETQNFVCFSLHFIRYPTSHSVLNICIFPCVSNDNRRHPF